MAQHFYSVTRPGALTRSPARDAALAAAREYFGAWLREATRQEEMKARMERNQQIHKARLQIRAEQKAARKDQEAKDEKKPATD